MEKNKSLLVGTLLTILMGLLGLQIYTGMRPLAIDLNLYELLGRDLTTTHAVTNLLYNSFHSWKFDPMVIQILKVFPNQSTFVLYSYHLFFFACGLFFYLDLIAPNSLKGIERHALTVLSVILLIVCLAVIWQVDLVLLSSITWLPYYLLGTSLLFQKKFLGAPLTIIFALLVCLSSGQLSLLYLSFFGLLNYLIFSKPPLGKIFKTELRLVFFLIFLLAVYVQIQIEPVQTPNYPESTRVVADDPMPGNARSVFGPNNVLESQDILLQHETFKVFALVLIIGLLLISLKNKAGIFLAVTGSIILADIFLPASITHILPLQSLERLIPHWIFMPLLPYLLFCLALGSFIVVANRYSLTLGLVLISSLSLASGIYLPSNSLKRFHAISRTKTQLHNSYSAIDRKLLNSPSAGILLENLDNNIQLIPKQTKAQFKSIKNFTAAIQSNYNQKESRFAIDDDLSTRWASKLAGQIGDEQLVIRFRKPKNIKGIRLDLAKHYTDYPRGLRVRYSESCEELKLVDQKILIEKTTWPGSTQATPDGFPYYGHQSQIKLLFPKTKVQCLAIEQIGSVDHWEFSITEIKVLLAKKQSL